MFPFTSRWRWWFSTGYLHIVEAVREEIEDFQEPYRRILRDRARKMEFGLRVRLVVLVLLNLGIVAAVLAWVAHVFPQFERLGALVGGVAGRLTGVSLVLTAVFVLLSRYLGQLQADMVASMVLGTRAETADDA